MNIFPALHNFLCLLGTDFTTAEDRAKRLLPALANGLGSPSNVSWFAHRVT